MSTPRVTRNDPRRSTYAAKIKGNLRDAIEEITAEVNTRPDVFDHLTENDVMRRFLSWAVTEHRAGRGPWAKL